MSDHKFSVILGLGGNSYSNLQVFGDSAEELAENIRAVRTGLEGGSVLELATETVYGVQGMYEAARQLGKAPEFAETAPAAPAEEKAEPVKKAPAKKGVAAKKKAEPKAEEPEVQEPAEVSDSLEAKIASAADGDALTALWKQNRASWTEELSALAKTRRAELEESN